MGYHAVCRLCPVFQVSNVTGENLNLLKMFLNLLTTRSQHSDNDPAEFLIDDTYSVPGNEILVTDIPFIENLKISIHNQDNNNICRGWNCCEWDLLKRYHYS